MTLDENKRKTLIAYRIEQAKETIIEAKIMIDNGKFRAAINRIYYGMFYILLALALKHYFETSKHSQLIGWFNKTFIKNNIIDQNYGRMIREAFEIRGKSDYDTYTKLTKEDVLKKFEEMNDFINALEQFILSDD